MPRRKKGTAPDEAVSTQAPVAVAEAPTVTAETPRDEPQPSISDATPASTTLSAADRFHSWVTDRSAGYERLTDQKEKLLVLKFRDKPTTDVLDKLKEAGFRYQPDYFGHKKAWTRRNDFEGRVRLAEVEKMIRGPQAEVIPF